MHDPSARRGFLRGLLSLPLIGGGVTLIGAPSAVAGHCSDATMETYVAWLAHEHREALVENERRRAVKRGLELAAEGITHQPDYPNEIAERTRRFPPMLWFPEAPAIEKLVASASPATRAALVLSAVGAEWRR